MQNNLYDAIILVLTQGHFMNEVQNMRAKEAAKYLGCGKSTIWLYAKQGKITPIKLSDRVTIFKKEDLDRFINAAS